MDTGKTKEKELIRFDWAMKRMLRDQANFDVLEGFLSAVLGEEIKIDSTLKEVQDQLDLMTMPREQRDAYIRHCHDEASYVYTRQVEQQIAREEGIAEGEMRAKIEMAKKMLALGLPTATIIECTGLTEEELLKL